jgi:hypothetical protein
MTEELATESNWQARGSARSGSRIVSRLAGVVTAAGCVAILVFASQGKAWAEYARTVAGLAMIAGCAWSVSALVGFLFGIPRTLSLPAAGLAGEESPAVAAGAARRSAPGRTPYEVHYRVNTNLEQISDWLTKILVGVGLAELHRLPGALRDGSDYFAGALGAQAPAEFSAFVLALLVYFSVVGFMTGYLGTRVLLAPLFKLADKKDVHAAVAAAGMR